MVTVVASVMLLLVSAQVSGQEEVKAVTYQNSVRVNGTRIDRRIAHGRQFTPMTSVGRRTQTAASIGARELANKVEPGDPHNVTGKGDANLERASSPAPVVLETAAWLAAIEKLLPMGDKVRAWFFGEKKEGEKKLKPKDIEDTANKEQKRVAEAMELVSEDIDRITAWRQLANDIDGLGPTGELKSIKDHLIEAQSVVRASNYYTGEGVFWAREQLKKKVKVSMERVIAVLNRFPNLKLRGAEATLVENALNDLASSLHTMTEKLETISDVPKPGGAQANVTADFKTALQAIATDLDAAVKECSHITTAHDRFQIELGMDFDKLKKDFGAKKDAGKDAKQAAALFNRKAEALFLLEKSQKRLENAQYFMDDQKQRLAAARTGVGSFNQSQVQKDLGEAEADVKAANVAYREAWALVQDADSLLKSLPSFPDLASADAALRNALARLKTK